MWMEEGYRHEENLDVTESPDGFDKIREQAKLITFGAGEAVGQKNLKPLTMIIPLDS